MASSCLGEMGSDLYYVFQHKQASASGLDGWEWRDLKAFPEAWFDWLAVVLSRVELDGIWPEGLFDASCHHDSLSRMAMLLLLGSGPLCVLPVVYRIGASVQASLFGWLASVLAPSFCV